MSELISGREFARRMGWKAPSYIQKLKEADRLVLVDGKVDYEASLQRLEATADPARTEEPDSNTREAPEGGPISDSPGAAGEAAPGDADDSDDDTAAPARTIKYADEKARNEFYKAEKAELEYRRRARELVDAEQVQRQASKLASDLRNSLMTWPGTLAETLAPVTDPAEVDRLLEAEVHKLLSQLALSARDQIPSDDSTTE